MKLSKNLSLDEVIKSKTAIRWNIDNSPTEDHKVNLVDVANHIFQPLRDHFGKPIIVSSGYRSSALNRVIKGSSSSQHCLGEALDLDNDGLETPTNKEIFDYIKKNLIFDQLIWEFGDDKKPDWVHVSYVDPSRKGRPNRLQILRARKNSAGKTYYENMA